jgi:hypothetical protein
MYLAKLTPTGSYVWTKRFGSGFFVDQAIDLVTDPDGNLYLSGAFSGTLDFGSIQLPQVGLSSVALAKYNSNGDVQWAKLIPNETAGPGGVAFSENHIYVAVGRTLAKFTLDGDTVWTRAMPTSAAYTVGYYNVMADVWGCIYVVGKMSGTVIYGTNTLSSSSINDPDILIVKYDPLGTVMWARRDGAISTPGTNDIGYAVATDSHGDVFVTGEYKGKAGFDTDSISSGNAIQAMFLAKYSSSGDVLWVMGSSGNFGTTCSGRAVQAFANDNVLVGAQFSIGTTFGGTNFNIAGGSDVLLLRVTADGVLRWGARSNTLATSGGLKALVLNSSGLEAYVGGFLMSAMTFGPTSMTIAGGAQDGFIAKMAIDPTTPVYEDVDAPLPTDFALAQNYPNPFNPTTTIEFRVPRSAHVSLAIFNSLGQRVRQLADQDLSIGNYSSVWDGRDDHGRAQASGVYFYRLQLDGYVETHKLTLLK